MNDAETISYRDILWLFPQKDESIETPSSAIICISVSDHT